MIIYKKKLKIKIKIEDMKQRIHTTTITKITPNRLCPSFFLISKKRNCIKKSIKALLSIHEVYKNDITPKEKT